MLLLHVQQWENIIAVNMCAAFIYLFDMDVLPNGILYIMNDKFFLLV